MFITLFNTVFPVFALVLIGWVYARIRPEVSTKSLNDLALYIGLPTIIIKNLVDVEIGDIQITALVVAAVFGALLPAVIGYVWLKLWNIKHTGLVLPIAFINAVSLPLPIIQLSWGAAGVAVATIYFTVSNILMIIFGIVIISQNNKVKEVLKFPYIYALIIAVILNIGKIPIPKAIDSFLTLSAGMAYPLMLIVLGIILAKSFSGMKFNRIKLAITAGMIRIAVGVISALIIVFLLGVEGLNRQVILFYGVMPGAITTTLFAEKYNRDSEVVAQTVFFGTLMSMAMIPLVLMILL